MAITANTVWEIQTGGSDDNGGGYDSSIAGAGTDYSQQTAAQLALSDATTSGAGSTTLTSATGGFTSAMVGNILYVRSGTHFQTGFYQVVTYTDTNNVILDRTPTSGGAAGSVGTFNLGGCRATVANNAFPGALVAGNTVYIKGGAYSQGGVSSHTAGTAAAPIKYIGYKTTRNDVCTGTDRPTFTQTTTTVWLTNAYIYLKNIVIISAGAHAYSDNAAGSNKFENCKITCNHASSQWAAFSVRSARMINCEAVAPSCRGVSMGTGPTTMQGCYVHDCAVGVRTTTGAYIFDTIIADCSSKAFESTSTSSNIIKNCTLYGAETPTGIGIDSNTTDNTISIYMNNIIYGFTTGVSFLGSVPSNHWDYNCFYNNTTDRTNVTAGTNDVAVNPSFTNAASGDFSITGAI
jgi:hypothetical protein